MFSPVNLLFMTYLSYILKSLFYYLKANLLVALGILVSTMVISGSLIIGDSIRYSLEQSVVYRLGNMTHLVSVSDRYFREEIAAEIEKYRSEEHTSELQS